MRLLTDAMRESESETSANVDTVGIVSKDDNVTRRDTEVYVEEGVQRMSTEAEQERDVLRLVGIIKGRQIIN